MSDQLSTPRWTALGTLPVVSAVLVGLNALYMILVVVGNITDFRVNQQFVHHVLAMDTINLGQAPGASLDPHVTWRALSATTMQDAVYIGIIIWESAAGLVLASALAMWFVDRGRRREYARRLSTIGLLMVLLLFFGGFIDIGGEWFQMWRSTAWNGLDTAFRNVLFAIATLIVIHLPSPSATVTVAHGEHSV
jgi:predicted small integral membrane protein